MYCDHFVIVRRHVSSYALRAESRPRLLIEGQDGIYS